MKFVVYRAKKVKITVTPVNDAPTASPEQPVATNEDTTVKGSIKVNDVDLQREGDTLTYTIKEDVSHGVLTLDPLTGQYTYVPNANYNGPDSFIVVVTDKAGAEVVIKIPVTVHPINDAPLFDEGLTGTDPMQPLQIGEDLENPAAPGVKGDALEGQVTAKDIDLGDLNSKEKLTYSSPEKSENGGTVVIDPVTGKYTYVPAKDFNGKDSFTITVTDSAGATDTVKIYVDVIAVDDPLEADKEQPLTTDSGRAYTGFIDVKDVDGDHLSFKFNTTGSQHIITQDGDLQTITLKDDQGANIGQLVLDTTTGVYTFSPDVSYKGDGFNGKVQDFFNVTVSDGVNTENDIIIKVDIWVNDKPVFVEGSEITLPIFDEDTYGTDQPFSGGVNATDEDNLQSELTYSVSKQPEHGRVEVDSKTGQYKFYPNENANGAYEFTIKVTDPRGLSSEIVIKGEITAVDDILTSNTEQPIAIQENEIKTSQIKVTDVDGDSLTYTVNGLTAVADKENTFTTRLVF